MHGARPALPVRRRPGAAVSTARLPVGRDLAPSHDFERQPDVYVIATRRPWLEQATKARLLFRAVHHFGDSDDPMSEGEVGRCGVSVDSLADMELLFDGIDLGSVSTSNSKS